MVFPGMDPVKFAGVGEFLTFSAHAQKRLKVADEVLGYALMDRYRRSADDYDEATQVAFLTISLALADWAEESLEVDPESCAGPSFGQRAMAAHSGALSFADTVRLTSSSPAARRTISPPSTRTGHTDLPAHAAGTARQDLR